MSTVVLHQFAISHFCEKVRWALALKGVEHRLLCHLPGAHARTARRLTGRSSLPVLELGPANAIGGSSAILDRLDTVFPEPRLTPAEPRLAEAARRWETYLDGTLGPAVRRVCYDTLLDHPYTCKALLAQGTPWYGKPLLGLMWPKLAPTMRKGFGLTAAGVARAREDIERALDALDRARDVDGYLVGGRFTRADLTAAALLAPLTREPGYGLRWPARLPDPVGALSETLAPRLAWVSATYAAHRPPRPPR